MANPPNEQGLPLQALKGEPIPIPAEVIKWIWDLQQTWVRESQERKQRELIEAQERKAQTEALERCTKEISLLRSDLSNLDTAFKAFKTAEEKDEEIERERLKAKEEAREELMREFGIDIEARVAPNSKSKAWWVSLADNKVLIVCLTIIAITLMLTLGGPGMIQAIQHWGGPK